MEKPIRIIENEKIRTFNDKVKNGLEHALNFMMGNENETKVQISHFEPFLMPIETYISAYKKQSVLIRIYSDKDYPGELYWFFEQKTAVLLGSLLRMIPIASIEEKLKKGDFDATDQDAFGEVGNQLSGILDRAFRTLTKKNIHLKMDFNKVIYPSDSVGIANFLNKEEYVVLLATVTIPKHGGQKLNLLLPRSMYEVMLNLELSLQGVDPKNIVIYSWNEDLRDQIQMNLNSRYTKVWSFEQPDEVLPALDKPRLAAVGFDLKKMQFPLQLQDQILLKRLASNRALSKLPYFLTWEGATEEEVKEVQKMGLLGATSGNFAQNFPLWAKSFSQDPSKS
jgi:hypothetical protein